MGIETIVIIIIICLAVILLATLYLIFRLSRKMPSNDVIITGLKNTLETFAQSKLISYEQRATAVEELVVEFGAKVEKLAGGPISTEQPITETTETPAEEDVPVTPEKITDNNVLTFIRGSLRSRDELIARFGKSGGLNFALARLIRKGLVVENDSCYEAVNV